MATVVRRMTPPHGLKGRFFLITPWAAAATKVYTVMSLRSFRELVGDAVDVYEEYYKPKGLAIDLYKRDLNAGAVLVILYSDDGEVIHVPDTYIQSYPNQDCPPYSNYVVSALLGPFRTDFDFSFVTAKIAEVISNTTGVEPTMHVDTVGEAQAISTTEAEGLEAGRQAAITNRETTYAQLLKEQERNVKLQTDVKALQDYILANPIPPAK